VRDNLERIKRTNDELTTGGPVMSSRACSSSRPTNALPPMLRAQTAGSRAVSFFGSVSRFIRHGAASGSPQPFWKRASLRPLASRPPKRPPLRNARGLSFRLPRLPPRAPRLPRGWNRWKPPSYDLEPTPPPPAPVELELPVGVAGVGSEFDIKPVNS